MTYDDACARPITYEDLERAMEKIKKPDDIRPYDPAYISLHAFKKLQNKIESGEEITWKELCEAHRRD